jgi:hypothetical protein
MNNDGVTGRTTFDCKDLGYGASVQGVRRQSINCLGRQNHKLPLPEKFRRLLNGSLE